MKTYYMHTLRGRPASYEDGCQIHYLSGAYKARLVPTLRQVRREQRASVKWRTGRGWDDNLDDYGHCLVVLP